MDGQHPTTDKRRQAFINQLGESKSDKQRRADPYAKDPDTWVKWSDAHTDDWLDGSVDDTWVTPVAKDGSFSAPTLLRNSKNYIDDFWVSTPIQFSSKSEVSDAIASRKEFVMTISQYLKTSRLFLLRVRRSYSTFRFKQFNFWPSAWTPWTSGHSTSSSARALGIPPAKFGFPDSDIELSVAYTFKNKTAVVSPGELFGVNITIQQPELALNPRAHQSIANYSGQYVVLMVDPDAPSPESPIYRFWLHWLAPNMTQSDNVTTPLVDRQLTNVTANFVPYANPTPPSNSSAHRYILYAFQQPDNFSIPEAFKAFSAEHRASFKLTEFISCAGLGAPAAAEYFYVSGEESVPADFIAEAGGVYPGGNGDAIFAVSTTTSSSA